jgi:hypothetical protein
MSHICTSWYTLILLLLEDYSLYATTANDEKGLCSIDVWDEALDSNEYFFYNESERR